MNTKLLFLFLVILSIFLSSCGTSKSARSHKISTSKKSEVVVSSKRIQLVSSARKSLGKKYKYGGLGKGGFDCSGLVYSLYQELNIDLPRRSRDMAKLGDKVSAKDALPGDLVFFQKGSNINHVALISNIYGEKMYIIHSTSSGGVIEENLYSSNYWKPKLKFIRRLIID